MTQNTLSDLNNHLFMQLERLNDEDMDSEELEKETKRARAISDIAKQVIDNANLALNVAKFNDVKLDENARLPRMLN